MKKVFCFVLLFQSVFAKDLYFIENQGQWNEKVLFLTRLNNVDIWITQTGITYDFYQNTPKIHPEDKEHPMKFQRTVFDRKGHIIEWKFINANKAQQTQKLKEKPFFHHYYLGNNPQHWKTHVKLYEEVLLKNVYKGIDLRCYFDKGQFRYDFIVNPYADYQQIAIQVIGSNGIQLIQNEPIIKTSLGEIRWKDLKVYQENSFISAKWNLEKNILRYQIANYDKSKSLVIDPILWSTFLGGNSTEINSKIDVDNQGNSYVTGRSTSSDFPTTTGAYSTAIQGQDVFISKLNASGSSLLYSTFFGGSSLDYSNYIHLKNGSLYICGYTFSQNFPITAGVYDNFFNNDLGNQQGFIAKFTMNGTLSFSTFLGNSTGTEVNSLVVNGANIYATGLSYCSNANGPCVSDFPTTVGTISPNYNGGGSDIFVSVLDTNGTNLIASTFLGGTSTNIGVNDEVAFDIDFYGNAVFICGRTVSTNFPTTVGAYDNSFNGGMHDAFVAKISPNLQNLLASTFLGGNDTPGQTEEALALTIDHAGSVYVVGRTYSSNFPISSNAFDNTINAAEGFIAKFNNNLTQLNYASFLGGESFDIATDVKYSGSGSGFRIAITGGTSSFAFPLTTNAINNNSRGPFITVLDLSCNLLFSTFIGNGNLTTSESNGIALLEPISSGNYGDIEIFITGNTQTATYVTTSGAFSNTMGDWQDGFVTKISYNCIVPYTISSNAPVCNGDTLRLFLNPGFPDVTWTGPNNFVSGQQNPKIPITSSNQAGWYYVTVIDMNGCIDKDSIFITLGAGVPLSLSSNSPVCEGQTIQLNAANGFSNYQWTGPNGFSSNDQNPTIANATSSMSGYYKLTATQGCTTTDSIYVLVIGNQAININDTTICSGNNVQYIMPILQGANYLWYNQPTGGTPLSIGINFQTPPLNSTTTYYVEIASTNCTSARDAFTINVVNPNSTSIQETSPIIVCRGNNVTIHGNTVGATTHLWYNQASGGTPLFNGNDFTINNLQFTTTYFVEAIVSGCTTQRIPFQIQVPQPDEPSPINRTICSGQDITINVNYNGTIHWFDAPTGGNLIHQGTNFTTPVLNQTTVYYIASQLNGCYSNRVTVTVNVIPNVPAPQVQDTTICTSSSVNISLSANSNYSIIWYDAPTGGNTLGTGTTINVNVNQTTTYYAEAHIPNCTSSRSALTVFVVSQPNPPLVQDTTICSGTSATIYAQSQSGNGNFLWYDQETGGNPIFSGNPFITPSLTQNTKYYVEFVVGNCTSSRVGMQVNVTPKPSDPSPIYRSNVCYGDTVNIIVGANATVLWYDTPNSNTPIHIGSFFETPNLFQNTTYYIEAVNTPCTSNRIEVNLNVIQVSNPQIDTLYQLCKGSNYTLLANPPQGMNVIWYNQNQNPISNQNFLNVLVDTTKQYFVAYTTSGCTSEKVLVTLETIPISVVANFTYDSLGQGNYVFYNTSQNGINYVWYFIYNNQVDSIIKNDTSSVNYTFQQNGMVQVKLRAYDVNGCFDEYVITIEVTGSQMIIWIPTGFTPNNDNINDEWFITHQGVKSLEWYLYDRWGNIIFQTQDANYRWDGSYQGKPCPEGVYTYLIWAKDFQDKKKKYMGTVTLIR